MCNGAALGMALKTKAVWAANKKGCLAVDYYETLGLKPDASADEVKVAYRTLSKRYHPDVNDAPNAAAFFRLLAEAYDVLGNEQSRSAYDAKRRTGSRVQEDADFAREEEPVAYEYARAAPKAGPRPKKGGALGFVLWLLLKVVCLPVIVVLVFFEKVLTLLAAVASVIGWIIFGLGVLGAIAMLISGNAGIPALIGAAAVAFLGFALPYIAAFCPAVLLVAREFLVENVLRR